MRSLTHTEISTVAGSGFGIDVYFPIDTYPVYSDVVYYDPYAPVVYVMDDPYAYVDPYTVVYYDSPVPAFCDAYGCYY